MASDFVSEVSKLNIKKHLRDEIIEGTAYAVPFFVFSRDVASMEIKKGPLLAALGGSSTGVTIPVWTIASV